MKIIEEFKNVYHLKFKTALSAWTELRKTIFGLPLIILKRKFAVWQYNIARKNMCCVFVKYIEVVLAEYDEKKGVFWKVNESNEFIHYCSCGPHNILYYGIEY